MAEETTFTNDALRLTISDSRVRRLVDKQCVNRAASEKIRFLKNKARPYEEAKKALNNGYEYQKDAAGKPILSSDDKKHPLTVDLTEKRRSELEQFLKSEEKNYDSIKDEITALSNSRIRFSDGVAVTFCTVLEYIVNELFEFAMKNCLVNDKKIIHVHHLNREGAEKLRCYPLIRNLPSWRNPPAHKPKSKEGGENQEQTQTSDKSSTFFYYITSLCREITHPTEFDANGNPVVKVVKDKRVVSRKQDGEYSSIRASTEIKNYINNLLVEFLERLSPLIQLQLQSMKVKTITEDTVLQVIHSIMVDGVPVEEKLIYEKKEVVENEALRKLKDQKAEFKKQCDDADRQGKARPNKPQFERMEDLPKKTVLVVEKELVFGNDAFDKIKECVDEKLKIFHEKKEEEKKKKEEEKEKRKEEENHNTETPRKVGRKIPPSSHQVEPVKV